jgi:hypothetical protein
VDNDIQNRVKLKPGYPGGAPMNSECPELVKELRAKVDDDRRRALIDAYLRKLDSQSMVDEAVRLLSKAVDENQSA